MKVYYGESTHQLLFSHHREPKQDMTYIILRTNFDRFEELLDYKRDLTGKGQFSFQYQRKAMPKNVQTTTQFHSSHTLAK